MAGRFRQLAQQLPLLKSFFGESGGKDVHYVDIADIHDMYSATLRNNHHQNLRPVDTPELLDAIEQTHRILHNQMRGVPSPEENGFLSALSTIPEAVREWMDGPAERAVEIPGDILADLYDGHTLLTATIDRLAAEDAARAIPKDLQNLYGMATNDEFIFYSDQKLPSIGQDPAYTSLLGLHQGLFNLYCRHDANILSQARRPAERTDPPDYSGPSNDIIVF